MTVEEAVIRRSDIKAARISGAVSRYRSNATSARTQACTVLASVAPPSLDGATMGRFEHRTCGQKDGALPRTHGHPKAHFTG